MFKPPPLHGIPDSPVETSKLNGVEPHAYLSDVLTRIAEGHPNRRLDELLPWAYARAQHIKAVAWTLRLRQISRLKMIKRTMYGRASFALLRRRTLIAA